ncbi:MAG: alpha/beta hydrolase [Pseudomonadota bacterium]
MTPTARPVLILVHGATLNGASWNPVRRHIDPRITLVTPDLPGHGARSAERFTLQGAVDTVRAAVDGAGGAPVVVGGDSLGGYTATACAAALAPGQLKGLVLSGCSTNVIGAGVLLPFVVKKYVTRLMTMLLNQRQLDEAVIKSLRKFGIGEPDITAMMDAGMNPRVFSQAVDGIRGVDFRAMVAAATQPILFVNGGNDAICMRQEASFFAAARAPQRHIFEKTEHGVSLLRSAEFGAVVNRFSAPLLGLAPL